MNQSSEAHWARNLAKGFRSTTELLDFLQLPHALASTAAEQQFRTLVPRGFAERMQKQNPHDPLLLQVLAGNREMVPVTGYSLDPLQENTTNPIPGLLHKYASRVLLMVTGACAVNCRYCFRRHFPYEENQLGAENLEKIMDYIQKNQQITEVILSGGDPLLLKNNPFRALCKKISAIEHVHTLRIHTRIPIVLPERIENEFIQILNETQRKIVVVLHCNHPQEIDASVERACASMRNAGFYLLNQSVLLAGINDNATILAELSQKLFAKGVLPYYLHVLDKVEGAAHFDLERNTIKKIYKAMQEMLPGYLVPRLVVEKAGEAHKVLFT